MTKTLDKFENPYRPGAGHMPPYLAGRHQEYEEFDRLLEQTVILENMVLTGLRGVGKTVLLDTFRPRAIKSGWLWAGTDMSESATVTEACSLPPPRRPRRHHVECDGRRTRSCSGRLRFHPGTGTSSSVI